jgi:Zn-dependent peptidase ImmA (M78 family)
LGEKGRVDRRVAKPLAGAPLERVYDCLLKLAGKREILLRQTQPLPGRISEALGVEPKGLCFKLKERDYIWIKPDLPLDKKLFVLAHELGHFMLHHQCESEVLYNSEYFTKSEGEADRFAEKLIALISLRLLRQ